MGVVVRHDPHFIYYTHYSDYTHYSNYTITAITPL